MEAMYTLMKSMVSNEEWSNFVDDLIKEAWEKKQQDRENAPQNIGTSTNAYKLGFICKLLIKQLFIVQTFVGDFKNL